MLFTDVIKKKRDGGELDEVEMQYFVDGLADESLPVEQVASLAMAIFLNSMSFEEAARLTSGMATSGTVLEWDDLGLDGPVVDKHSTGGVGDKVSFMLAPIAAACGCYVPMISGRGLGHTGGTTDKAESIPGYDVSPDLDRFREVVSEVGCAIIGQTSDLAPADRRLYAIRDVTATVPSIPLITASILSKKIAAGLQGLVMDIKTGNGAFMETLDRGRELSNSIIWTAAKAGLKTHTLITDMNEVLGSTAGNAVEIAESVRFLRNDQREPRLNKVVLALCAEMLLVSGIETERDVATRRCDQAVTSGKAAEIFGRMVAAMGGPADFMEKFDSYLPHAPIERPVYAEGIVVAVDTRQVGHTIIELGGGRHMVGEMLDLSVGLTDVVPIGTELDSQTPLAVIHAASSQDADLAEQLLCAAVTTGDTAPRERPVIHEILTG
jgi:thymidine phosphorylase